MRMIVFSQNSDNSHEAYQYMKVIAPDFLHLLQ